MEAISPQEAGRSDAEVADGDAGQSRLFLEGRITPGAGQSADPSGRIPESGIL